MARWCPRATCWTAAATRKTDVYSVDQLHGMLPLFNDIYAGAEKAGIKAETLISEFAPGQYELTLHYRTDVMQAADDLMRLKRIVRMHARAAWRDRLFHGQAERGSTPDRACISMSRCWTTTGSNVFVEVDEGQWNDTILHALGGLRATMGESMLVFAPHANSWRRFASQSYAPGQPDLGRQQPLGGAAHSGRRHQGPARSNIARRAWMPTPIWWRQPFWPASATG